MRMTPPPYDAVPPTPWSGSMHVVPRHSKPSTQAIRSQQIGGNLRLGTQYNLITYSEGSCYAIPDRKRKFAVLSNIPLHYHQHPDYLGSCLQVVEGVYIEGLLSLESILIASAYAIDKLRSGIWPTQSTHPPSHSVSSSSSSPSVMRTPVETRQTSAPLKDSYKRHFDEPSECHRRQPTH